jgi:hypothetical protein
VKTKDDQRENQTAGDQGRFIQHLEEATEKVCSWPKWKQRLLGASIQENECNLRTRKDD